MLSMFNGRSRTLGDDASRRDVHLQMSIGLRKHIHLFKGAKMAIFIAIALHSDESGWAWPTVETLQKETGVTRDTIHAALNQLTELKIKGHRVLLRTKFPPQQYVQQGDGGKYARNFYLLFPSDGECEKYETENAIDKQKPLIKEENAPNHVRKTGHGFSESEKPDMENPYPVFPDTNNNHSSKPEPSLKPEPHTHNQNHAQLPAETPVAPSPPPEKRVCVIEENSTKDLEFADYLAFARGHPSFNKPEAWASVHFNERDAPSAYLVREWLEGHTPERIAETRATPDEERMTYHEAEQRIRSALAIGEDAQSWINAMPVDADVRARLVEKFVVARTGTQSDAAARGHPPSEQEAKAASG